MPAASSPCHQQHFSYYYAEADEASPLGLNPSQRNIPVEAATPTSFNDVDMEEQCPNKTYTTLVPKRSPSMDAEIDPDGTYNLQEEPIAGLQRLKKDPLWPSFANASDPADTRWNLSPPDRWTNDDVIDWLYHVASNYKIPHDSVYGEHFQGINGQYLCKMTLDDFRSRDKVNGPRFYDTLQTLLRETCSSISIPSKESYHYDIRDINTDFNADATSGSDSDPENYSILPPLTGPTNDLNTSPMLLPTRIAPYSYPFYQQPMDVEISMDNKVAVVKPQVQPRHPPIPDFNNNNSSQGLNSSSSSNSSSGGSLSDSFTPKKRGPGRPRKHPIDSPYPGKSKKKPENDDKVLLWKFLRDLLLTKDNERIIKWEDKANGVFRIVDSKQVSGMWGRMKNNEKMNYEKMSRAIRFCRDKGFFDELPKEGNFPKKLCFKFGDKAMGWR